jgi:putative zinc finger/helix-turn-helix YgiT family protein
MRASEKCPACGATETRREIGRHHFLESGLSNVWLTNVGFLVCGKCGERILRLPNPIGLVKCIGEGVILTPGPLSGKEIKFLRKSLFLKSSEFANLIGVVRTTVSRWENAETTPDTSSDRLIRLTYANKMGLQEGVIKRLLERFQKEDVAKQDAKPDLDYFLPLSDQGTPYQCNLFH